MIVSVILWVAMENVTLLLIMLINAVYVTDLVLKVQLVIVMEMKEMNVVSVMDWVFLLVIVIALVAT